MKDIAVALGGGGARGLAHIGVLRVLEREGFRIRAVAGTSMGGIIGAGYASTLSADRLLELMEYGHRGGLLKARPGGPGLIGVQVIEARLSEYFGDQTFSDLQIPFAVSATNLHTGEEVVLREGNLVEALMATIALPGIFPPMSRGYEELVDGGVVDPVPVRMARSLFPGPVVASVLSPPREQWETHPSPSPLSPLPLFSLVTRLRPGRALQIFIRSMEIAARSFTELRLEVDRPEVIIRPPVSHIALLGQPSVEEVAALGEKAATEALPKVQAQFSAYRRLGRYLRRVRS